ncbi:hypothetical protein [Plebeiibacterium sediminum]|uniref:Uncharacterized protein n=1 Tax=Plebeiibacterium sediminum TaxID=2992112 RepID=A0AAE3SH02_9BACT|nr:hypothetical protein [Plebeiobacterium sediminum]MCW3788657.1 hypothetical protein [Plebeiobacterium sediminum]
MDLNYTSFEENIEEYSLSLIKVIENLPDTFFININLSPLPQTIQNILNFSKSLKTECS